MRLPDKETMVTIGACVALLVLIFGGSLAMSNRIECGPGGEWWDGATGNSMTANEAARALLDHVRLLESDAEQVELFRCRFGARGQIGARPIGWCAIVVPYGYKPERARLNHGVTIADACRAAINEDRHLAK